MTTFGIILVVYYIINIISCAIVVGLGGVEVGPGSALFSMIVQGIILFCLFSVGTGLGVF